jgi:hypothetical protein
MVSLDGALVAAIALIVVGKVGGSVYVTLLIVGTLFGYVSEKGAGALAKSS